MGLPIRIEQIQQSILLIRGKKVMLDADLAQLYGVSTKRLNEQEVNGKFDGCLDAIIHEMAENFHLPSTTRAAT